MLVDRNSGPAAECEGVPPPEQVREMVMQLAATLPELSRRIVVMRWIDGRAVREIGRKLEVTEDRVWAILRRFRLRLQQSLRALGPEP